MASGEMNTEPRSRGTRREEVGNPAHGARYPGARGGVRFGMQPLLACLVGLALHALPEARAGTPEHPVWLGGMVDFGAGVGESDSSGPGGGFQGFIGAEVGRVPSRSFGLEGRIGEGGWGGASAGQTIPLRMVGNIDVDVRYPAGSGPFAFVGFAHHHELPADDAVDHVGGAIAATYKGITHRTGFELGAGWDVAAPFPDSAFGSRIRPTARLNVVILPDGVAPPVYLVGNLGLTVGLGKAR